MRITGVSASGAMAPYEDADAVVVADALAALARARRR